jgi:hypothetical protein
MDILLCDPAKKAPIPTMSTCGAVEADNASGLARIVRTRIDEAVAENTRRIFRRL